MQLNHLKPKKKKRSIKRVGRGGARGKTSGRGHKGQKAHGGTPRPAMRDIIKKIPKKRGYGKNRARTVNPRRINYAVINLSQLKGMKEVNPESLFEAGLIRKKSFPVKILGKGEVSEKITVSGCSISESAKEKIIKAGGICKT